MTTQKLLKPHQLDRYCRLGIAATEAVDKLRKSFKDPHGMFEEEFLIEVGVELETQVIKQWSDN
jgi:hypothetical protein